MSVWDVYHFPLLVDSHHGQTMGNVAESDHRKICDAIAQGSYSMAKDALAESMRFWYDSLQKE